MNYLTTEDGKPINDNNPLAVKDSGTAGTGITPPTGATGISGWLSGVYNALVTAGIKIGAGTALMGKVGIDQTTDGTTNRVVAKISQTAGENLVQLSGSIPEYAWFTGAEQSIPTDQTKFAWGYEFDETTGEISAYGWSGAAWVKVVI